MNDSPLAPALFSLSEREFSLFQGLIQREAGIFLATHKKALLANRLTRRLRTLSLQSFLEYYQILKERDPRGEELQRCLNCICTNETHFFREPRQFEFLERRVFPLWQAQAAERRRPLDIKVWSAACSTGQEPYSIAMSLLSEFPQSAGWRIQITATDLSTSVLEQAAEGLYPAALSDEIPERYRKNFMLRGVRSKEGWIMAGPELRELVRFQRLNLNDATYPVSGSFDLIFCRNVLIYFSQETKVKILSRLAQRLTPTGYLFLGHAEGVLGGLGSLQNVGPTVYSAVGDLIEP